MRQLRAGIENGYESALWRPAYELPPRG